jgi:hypothetical protein
MASSHGCGRYSDGAYRLIAFNALAFDGLVHWARRFPSASNEHYLFPWCEHRQTDATRPAKGWRTALRHALKRRASIAVFTTKALRALRSCLDQKQMVGPPGFEPGTNGL